MPSQNKPYAKSILQVQHSWSILKNTSNPMDSHNSISFFLVHIQIPGSLFFILHKLTLSKEYVPFFPLFFP